jgi:hypothetical protein
MKNSFFFIIIIILGIFFSTCATEHSRYVLTPPVEVPELIEPPVTFIITDHKNHANGGNIPEWVNSVLEGGVRSIRALEANGDNYIFITRNEGNNFNALGLWVNGFIAEMDFPRLAAARVLLHFSAGVHFPDETYGAFYETLIRDVSDFHWTGMLKEDDFWIRRKFPADEDEPESEDWEFFILVIVGKTHFAAQLDSIFQNINPRPAPTGEQALAARRVIDRIFDEF